VNIPAIPVQITGGNAVTSHILFSGTDVRMDDNPVSYGDLVSSLSGISDKGTPILAVDVVGLRKGDIEPGVLRKLKTKHNVWLMTGIRDTGDVMDAFHGDISKLVVPYHLTTDGFLKEMIALSDSCIPALFIDGEGVHMSGRRREPRTVIRTLENIGFRKMLLFDVSGGDVNTWMPFEDLADMIIPYASSMDDADAIHKIGFNDVLVSGIKLFKDVKQRSEIRSCMLP
jgi:hypothetical protein